MIRRLFIAFLALVVVLVVVADRVGAHVAAHVLAGKLQTDEHLPSRPSVSIGGIPFLTQAFHGDYSNVKVAAHDYKTKDGVEISALTAHLYGVHIPLSRVVDGSVSTVPVDHVSGTAFVSFGDITKYLVGRGLHVNLSRASSGAVTVAGRLPVAGHLRTIDAAATVTVSHAVVTLAIAKRSKILPAVDLTVPLRALPFRIAVTSVSVGANGITGSGTAVGVTLGS